MVESQDLGFNNLINANLIRSIPKFLIPTLLFLLSGVISYTIGSACATWALMMPLAINISFSSGVSISIMIRGGAVTNIISPLSTQMADTSFCKHLTKSFPYVIAGVILTSIAYMAVGFFV